MAEVDLGAVKAQVEFYFGDANFRRDKFMKGKTRDDPDGFISIDTLLTFNKLKALTTDAAKVAEALAESDVVEVGRDGTAFKRKHPLPTDSQVKDRSVALKGFGEGNEEVTIDSVTDMVKGFGTVGYVQLRRGRDRKFQGTVIVEFAEQAAADELLKRKAELKYKDEALVVLPCKVWEEAEFAGRPKKRDRDSRDGDDIKDAFEEGIFVEVKAAAGTRWGDVKRTLAQIADVAHVAEVRSAEEPSAKKQKVDDEAKEGEAKEGEEATEAKAEDATEAKADEEAAPEHAIFNVKMRSPEAANKVIEAGTSEAGILVDDAKVAVRLLTGEDEQKAWVEERKSLQANRERARNGGGRGRGRGRRGGRGRGYGRRR